jgi:hypothetical protein
MDAAPYLTTVVARGNAFLEAAREQARDGLTWQEFGRLLVQLLYLLVSGLDAVAGMSGPEKKAIVLIAAEALFDRFADLCVPAVAWPAWVIIRPATRTLILALASGGVEALLPITRSPA